jgi:hypothetical protein
MGEVGHVGSGPNNVYTCMIPVETVLGIWGGGMKRTEEWVNSSMIYLIHCKNFYKCHDVPPASTTIKKLNKILWLTNDLPIKTYHSYIIQFSSLLHIL